MKKLEERTQTLNQTRNDLFKQLNAMEKMIEDKLIERDELRTKVQIKQTSLDEKERELEKQEMEVKNLRSKLTAI